MESSDQIELNEEFVGFVFVKNILRWALSRAKVHFFDRCSSSLVDPSLVWGQVSCVLCGI